MEKIIKCCGHQGDTEWFLIEKLPDGLGKPIEKQFIAKSEKTGNVHALSGKYNMYEFEGEHIIEVLEDCQLNHTGINELNNITWETPIVLPERDHHTSVIKKGIYYVGIQQRFNPLSVQMEKVKD